MIKQMRVEPPEQCGKSKVNPSMTISESIMDSIIHKPIREADREKKLAFLKKYNPEQYLFETRGNNNLEPNLELLDEQEKAGQ